MLVTSGSERGNGHSSRKWTALFRHPIQTHCLHKYLINELTLQLQTIFFSPSNVNKWNFSQSKRHEVL